MKNSFKARTKVSDFSLKISLVTLLQLFALSLSVARALHKALDELYKGVVVYQGSGTWRKRDHFVDEEKRCFTPLLSLFSGAWKRVSPILPVLQKYVFQQGYVMTALASTLSRSSGEAKIKWVHCRQNRVCNSVLLRNLVFPRPL